MDKSVELRRRLKEERLRKCSFVAGQLFHGATTRSEKEILQYIDTSTIYADKVYMHDLWC